jgi:hypothetical protein
VQQTQLLIAERKAKRVGLLDFLFGKKIKLEIPDKNGKIVKKKISKKTFDELVAQGKIKPVETVKAHVLDPIRGYYIADWVVDNDVHREDVEKFATPNGELYVVIAYMDGEPQTMLTKKEVWKKQRSIFDLIDKGEDYQGQLDAHISDLKKKIKDSD